MRRERHSHTLLVKYIKVQLTRRAILEYLSKLQICVSLTSQFCFFLIDIHKQNGLYSRLFTALSLIPAKLGEWLNKLWFILTLYSHKKNEELFYQLTGKYMQDILISACKEGGMWKRSNARCRSVPIKGYQLWQKEEKSRCIVKITSIQKESK